MPKIWQIILSGFWQGIGVEISFFVLWAICHSIHKAVGDKIDPEHFFHDVYNYFSK